MRTLAVFTTGVLPGAADAGAQVAAHYEPGEERVWVMEQGDAEIGRHWFRYEGRVLLTSGPHRFTGGVRILASSPMGEVEQKILGEFLLDDQGHPQHARLELEINQNYTRIEAEFEGESARCTVTQGPSRTPITRPLPAACFLLANNFLGLIELVLALDAPDPEGAQDFQLFALNTLQALPYRVEGKGAAVIAGLDGEPLDVHKYEDSLGEVLYLADGVLERLELPGQGIVMRRLDEPAFELDLERPDTVLLSERFDAEEVTIEYDGVSLAGTLTRARGTEGRLPAVFFLSGSGSQDRNGFGSGIDVGTHEILDRLTEEGYLVLRVDDRGAGGSTAPMSGAGYDELVADAAACLDFLRQHPAANPEQIVLIGHSEGGVTAPLLALRPPGVAAIVLMAAPGRGLFDIMREQQRWAADQAGLEKDERERTLEEQERWLMALASERDLDPLDFPPEVRPQFAQRAWFQDHARQDPIATIQRVTCSVLIAQGARDFQVSLERDAKALEAALKEVAHPDFELVSYPDLDHLFKKVIGTESQLSDYSKPRAVDGRFLDDLVAWLEARVPTAKK